MAVIIAAYGWLEGFQQINFTIIMLSIFIAMVSVILDYFSGPYLARKKGGSKGGYWGALLGGIVGILTLGPLGLLLGPFAGAVIGEIIYGKNIEDASKIGIASLAGLLIGNIIKFILAAALLILFFFRVFL
jgi:uncharacterized protein YqgC (DUF456 family)